MSFLPNIPQSGDQLSVSQGNILNNFQLLGAIAGNANPSSSSINGTAGFNWIYLPTQGALAGNPPPGSSFTANNIGLYSATNPTTLKNELYINKQDQATTVQIPATASILSITSAPALNSQGWTYLPSGIFMKWGSFTGATGLFTVTISGPTFPNSIITVLVSPYNPSTTGDSNFAVRVVDVGNPTVNTFRVFVSNRTTTGAATGGFTYLAIGY